MIYPVATAQTVYKQYVERMFMNRKPSFTYNTIEKVAPYHEKNESIPLYKDNRKKHLSSFVKDQRTNGIDKKGTFIDYYA